MADNKLNKASVKTLAMSLTKKWHVSLPSKMQRNYLQFIMSNKTSIEDVIKMKKKSMTIFRQPFEKVASSMKKTTQ